MNRPTHEISLVGRRVLVVDDDPDLVEAVVAALRPRGLRVLGTTDPQEALAQVAGVEPFDVVVTDLVMAPLDGLALMRAIHAQVPDQLVLVVTAFGSVETAVEAVRAGAAGFVPKPFTTDGLLLALERALHARSMYREVVRLRSEVAERPSDDLVAVSPAMRRALERARRAAGFEMPVLLTGESGVGKGLLAREIHRLSRRRDAAFVQVNAAAVPESLAEAELFGVRRGAFTDAREDRPGLFERADGGTLFLDELGELPLPVQAKLLVALETGRVRRVGDSQDRPVDVRIVAATNAALQQAVAQGRFRSDLLYRLEVISVPIPPLRERPEDLEPLINLLLARICARHGRPVPAITAPAHRWLAQQRWPGNVRELANVLERAVVMADHDALMLEDVCPGDAEPGPAADPFAQIMAQGLTLEAVQRRYFETVFAATGGNKAETGRLLGVDRRTIYRWLDEAPEEA